MVDIKIKESVFIKDLEKKIKEENNLILKKHVLLSDNYAKDFTVFMFKLILHPQLKHHFIEIYEILGRLSFGNNCII